MDSLAKPIPESVIYEDEKVYICLASFPITKGHTIVVWKSPVSDLNLLERKDYEYLMDLVDNVRGALLQTLKVEKVYLLYMDEVKHVHWHLVPRFNEEGFNVFSHEPKESHDFSLVPEIKKNLAV
jgi:histidine triad (HIT) family protein